MQNISAKELSGLEDTLGQEQILVKKYKTFANQCTDPALKTKCEQIATKHEEHYTKLLNYLS